MCDATEGRNRQRRVFEKGGHLRCADTARTSGSNEGRGLSAEARKVISQSGLPRRMYAGDRRVGAKSTMYRAA
jgi:hypothetical protein